jgi:hypothetical protein
MHGVGVGEQQVFPTGQVSELVHGVGFSVPACFGERLAEHRLDAMLMVLGVPGKYRPGAVGRLVVEHEYLVILVGLLKKRVEAAVDIPFFVPGGDQHRDLAAAAGAGTPELSRSQMMLETASKKK